jgi:O-antigen/teichoic acid export membrane protein
MGLAPVVLSAPADAHGPLSLRANFLWTFAGTAIYSTCSWAVLSVLAKLGGAVMMGEYALALAVVLPVMMLANVNLRAVLVTDTRGYYGFAEYRNVRLATTLTALGAIVLVSYAMTRSTHLAVVGLLVGGTQATEALSDIYYAEWQRNERMDSIAVSMCMRGLLSLFAFAQFIWLVGALVPALMAMIVARLVIFLAYDMPHTRIRIAAGLPADNLRPREGRRRAKELILKAAPLGLVLMLSSFNANIPRYLLGGLGLAQLGTFAGIASLITVGSTVINALGQSATPRLARDFAGGDLKGFRSLGLRLLLTGAGIGITGVVLSRILGPYALALMFRPDFSKHVDLLTLLMLSGCITYLAMLLGYIATAARAFREQVPLLAIVVGVCTTCSVMLIPRFGSSGAAFSLLVASLVHGVGELVIVLMAVRHRQPEVQLV